MTDSIPKLLHLNALCQSKPERPGWSLTFGATCQDGAAVCLDDQNHPYRVTLQIDGIQDTEVELQWNAIDDTVRRFNADQEVATEYGAYGIAALLMPYLTGLTVIERSIKGKGFGFDFWLGSIDNPDTLFQRKARLEVSGIRKGSESIIQSRAKMKLEQISPSDTLSPGYVCVVEFSTPRTRIIEKCKT
ncbi:MAG: hypothetical protein KME60_07895 [Cyanomargarita calcarea GSE-NOS-MK-12-04C]|jgi:hypothetical protein|uniref:Uncharacterized protein n=1 Tax=Cyanomargarita calcarea GSE-NOS-MK-12-04C TaxID=2839659 RepID=A0A951QJ98_9CYAN|nr:hypothetical protein [Cyanomargarita calcarea GSE-NOS-MK-12-04C]